MLKFIVSSFLAILILPSIVFAKEPDLLSQINKFREENGLPPVQSNFVVCSFAMQRAREIKDDFSHKGFIERKESNSLPFPEYKRVVENLGRTRRDNVVKLWIASPSHSANLLKNTQFACVQNSGYYYAYEGLEV